MEFPGILRKGLVKVPRGQLNRKWNFQGCSRKNHVELPYHDLAF